MQPRVLVAVLLGAALHDRPMSWAREARHGHTTTLRSARLPSPAALSRRRPGVPVSLLLRAVEDRRPALLVLLQHPFDFVPQDLHVSPLLPRPPVFRAGLVEKLRSEERRV